MKKYQSTIADAYFFEQKGLLRRARTVWQDIAVRDDNTREDRELAWQRLDLLDAVMEQKQRELTAQLKMYPDRKINAEEDRQKVIAFFKSGLSASQI